MGQPVSPSILFDPSRAVVVTGASSGIGLATVHALIAAGFSVFPTVRTEADGETLRKRFGRRVDPQVLDVRDSAQIAKVAAAVEQRLEGHVLRGLVNNAGMTGGGPLQHQPLDEILEILRVNGLSPLEVTRAFLPSLGADGPDNGQVGRVINVSSIGGRIAMPFAGAYQGAKHALEGYSDALRRELAIVGIRVVVIQPGAIATPIWGKTAALRVAERYRTTRYGTAIARFEQVTEQIAKTAFPAERAAHVIVKALTTRRPAARYAVVRQRLLNWDIPRLLPDRAMDWVTARLLAVPARAE